MAQLSLALSRPELCSPGTAHTPSLLSACHGAQHSFHLAHHGIHRCRLGQECQVGGRMPPQHQPPPHRCVLGRKLESLFFLWVSLYAETAQQT